MSCLTVFSEDAKFSQFVRAQSCKDRPYITFITPKALYIIDSLISEDFGKIKYIFFFYITKVDAPESKFHQSLQFYYKNR